MLRNCAIIFFLLVGISAKAQLHSGAFHAQWSILTPLSDKNYIGKTSAAGMRFGFSKFINDRFGFGFEGGYASLADYIPRATYYNQGGAYTTDFHNYLTYYTVMASGQYFFSQGEKFLPYASLGMGVGFSNYQVFYNVYEENDSKTGFVVRPEVGTLFRPKEYANWGLKASLSYDFTANKSAKFEVGNLSGIGFQIGVVFFTD